MGQGNSQLYQLEKLVFIYHITASKLDELAPLHQPEKLNKEEDSQESADAKTWVTVARPICAPSYHSSTQ